MYGLKSLRVIMYDCIGIIININIIHFFFSNTTMSVESIYNIISES